VYVAESIDAARRMCPVLGGIAVEQVNLLLELEALGNEILTEEAQQIESAQAQKVKPNDVIAKQVTQPEAFLFPMIETDTLDICQIDTAVLPSNFVHGNESYSAPKGTYKPVAKAPIHLATTQEYVRPTTRLITIPAPKTEPEKAKPLIEKIAVKIELKPVLIKDQSKVTLPVKKIKEVLPIRSVEAIVSQAIDIESKVKDDTNPIPMDGAFSVTEYADPIPMDGAFSTPLDLDISTPKLVGIKEAEPISGPTEKAKTGDEIMHVVTEEITSSFDDIRPEESAIRFEALNDAIDKLEAIYQQLDTPNPKIENEVELEVLLDEVLRVLFEELDIETKDIVVSHLVSVLLGKNAEQVEYCADSLDYLDLTGLGTHEAIVQLISELKHVLRSINMLYVALGNTMLYASRLTSSEPIMLLAA
jgi:hypothetical protein